MVIQVKEGAQIENPREYAPQEIDQLRHLLAAGSRTHRDPRREHFYEIEGKSETYYIHISPISGNVVLVAKWIHQPEDCCIGAGQIFA